MPYYRRNICVLSVTIFLTAASWNQVVPFLPLFLKEIGAGGNLFHWIGIVFAAQSVAGIVAMPYWGKLGDRHGRKVMVLRAGTCLAGVYFAMSFCHAPWQLALCRFLNGALTGFIPGSITLIATNTPDEHAPRALATAQSASAAGLIVGPALGGLLASLMGYRGSMRVSGTAVLISTLLVLWLVKEPNRVAPDKKTSLLQDFGISLRSPVMTYLMCIVMVQTVFGAAISPVLTLHLRKLGGNPPDWLTGAVFAIPAFAFVVSAQRWARFGQRGGFERTISIGLVGSALSIFSLYIAHSIWVFAFLYFATGLFIAAISPAASAITCFKVDEGFRGRAYGMQHSAALVGAFIAPLAASQIGASFGIPAIFVFVGTVFVIGWFVSSRMRASGADPPTFSPGADSCR